MPPLPSQPFEEAMTQLAALVARSQARRAANLNRLASMTARLDVLYSEPSPQPGPTPASRSTPEPMPPSSLERSDDLRALLPDRTTHGGPYGTSILERVAANYGLD